MNKAELVAYVAKKTNITKVQSEKILDAALTAIQSAVARGDDVRLVGFGTFTRATRKARIGQNPRTGKAVEIPPARVPKFKPGKEFKDTVK